MTDNEIVKALECCSIKEDCKGCYFDTHEAEDICAREVVKNAFDLINRQQAEIERLNRENNENFDKWNVLDERTKKRYAELYEEAKSVVRTEAVKEFAEKVKEKLSWDTGYDDKRLFENDIDEIVKEIAGDAK